MISFIASSGRSESAPGRIDSIGELVSVLKANGDFFTGFGSVPAGLNMDATGRWIDEHIAGNGLRGLGEIALAPVWPQGLKTSSGRQPITAGAIPVDSHLQSADS
jgi:hypothetical protein